MKRFWCIALILTLLAVCAAAPASAARSLIKDGEVVPITRPSTVTRPSVKDSCEVSGHNWKVEAESNPTCTSDGVKISVCSRCGEETKTTKSALGHNWQKGQKVAATCTASGVQEYECSRCDKKKEESIKALGHSYGEWKILSHTSMSRTCSRCGKKETKTGSGTAPKITPTPKPDSIKLQRVTPTPKPDTTKLQRITPTPKPDAGKLVKATATPKKSSGSKNTASYETFDYTAQEGMVEVFTTTGKVNLRKGPGKKNAIANTVPTKNTSLGELLESDVDGAGNVWYKVRYKNKVGWVTSDYATAVPGDVVGDRTPHGNGTELTAYFLNSFADSASDLSLRQESDTEAVNDHLMIGGTDYVESIELYGKDYTVYGVEVGMTVKKAKSLLKNKGLYCSRDTSAVCIFERPCQPNSISVNSEGFDAYIELIIDDEKCVEMINMYKY